jgi:hypothetical protein
MGKIPASDIARSITTHKGVLFRTSQGFLGQCPRSLQVGDEVWMLENASVPFILRKERARGKLHLN